MPPISVLLVDDHAVMREALELLVAYSPGLALWGSAASVVEAIALLSAPGPGGPDLVVTDVEMPVVNGLQLVASVRALWPTLPCVVYSVHSPGLYAEKAREAGAAAYVDSLAQGVPVQVFVARDLDFSSVVR